MSKIKVMKAEYDEGLDLYVTEEEGYTPDEWMDEARECPVCGDRFVVYVYGDDEPPNGVFKMTLCSDECKLERKRQQARDWQRQAAKRRLASASA